MFEISHQIVEPSGFAYAAVGFNYRAQLVPSPADVIGCFPQ